jgi:hypothetical protein
MPEAIPLFNPDALKVNIDDLAKQLEALLIKASTDYIRDNQDDGLALGEETIKAIIFKGAVKFIDIPVDLPLTMSLDDRAVLEDLLSKRDLAFSLVAKAQRENSARVARVWANTQKTTLSITTGVLVLVLKAFLGG